MNLNILKLQIKWMRISDLIYKHDTPITTNFFFHFLNLLPTYTPLENILRTKYALELKLI